MAPAAAPPGAARAASVPGPELTSGMLGYYNADRAANGLPSVNVINPAMQQGCLNHDNYMALNHEMVHGEQPGKPGYTPQGNYRDGAGGGEVLAEDVSSGWTASYEPWRTAPIHLYLLFDPTVHQVGYANAYGLQCMRMRGPDTAPMTEPAPRFYASRPERRSHRPGSR